MGVVWWIDNDIIIYIYIYLLSILDWVYKSSNMIGVGTTLPGMATYIAKKVWKTNQNIGWKHIQDDMGYWQQTDIQ